MYVFVVAELFFFYLTDISLSLQLKAISYYNVFTNIQNIGHYLLEELSLSTYDGYVLAKWLPNKQSIKLCNIDSLCITLWLAERK